MSTPSVLSAATSLQQKVQGRWRLVYSEIDGQMTPVADIAGIILENKGNTFTVEKNGTVVHEGTFSANVLASPHELVYVYRKGADVYLGGPRPGIIQVEGDTLKTCMGAIGHRFPKDFSTSVDSETVLSIHQRVSDDKSKATPGAPYSRTRAVSQW